ncbi:GNAT family N-acetyltransferase [Candidatus Enterococcus willemsii]|uniref:N-acetyltransferase domain-containing protein n=1 Tax=Candidatus Enterococcus willemsii TaxID=1857215 RepID=A0ABQ6YX22_9ENTE|nr:GNAT family N-acetyltransferase [Enterococcus sp. CU12B]KAF1302381.1 hypothetical protein BAU17_08985 [Enterococcus sp. CU12B]
MLTFKKIMPDSSEVSAFNQLYEKSFPAEERVPFKYLLNKIKQNKGNLLGLYDKEKIVGMMYYIERADLVYLFYFAIDDAIQSRGYGKEALKFFTNQFKDKKIALVIEELNEQATNIEQRYRRLRFYERQGFCQTGEEITEMGETYALMRFKNNHPIKKEYVHLMQYFWSLPIYYFFEGYNKVLLWRKKSLVQ